MCGHRSVAAPTKRVVKFINFAQNRLVQERFENLVAPKNRFFLRMTSASQEGLLAVFIDCDCQRGLQV